MYLFDQGHASTYHDHFAGGHTCVRTSGTGDGRKNDTGPNNLKKAIADVALKLVLLVFGRTGCGRPPLLTGDAAIAPRWINDQSRDERVGRGFGFLSEDDVSNLPFDHFALAKFTPTLIQRTCVSSGCPAGRILDHVPNRR